jgi:hypothetical protein
MFAPRQDHSLSRLVDQKIEEAQRLRVGLHGRELLGLVGVGSFVRRYEIHAQASLCDVTGRVPITRRMGGLPEKSCRRPLGLQASTLLFDLPPRPICL